MQLAVPHLYGQLLPARLQALLPGCGLELMVSSLGYSHSCDNVHGSPGDWIFLLACCCMSLSTASVCTAMCLFVLSWQRTFSSSAPWEETSHTWGLDTLSKASESADQGLSGA